MSSFTEKIISGKMSRHSEDIEEYISDDGYRLEKLFIKKGHTIISRQIFEDESRSSADITTQSVVIPLASVRDRYTVKGGELVVNSSDFDIPLGPINKLRVLARVAFGKVVI